MSIEKCHLCGNEYDNEENNVCPLCEKKENIQNDLSEDVICEITEKDAFDEPDEDFDNEEKTSMGKSYKIIIAVLSLLIALCVLVLVYLKLPLNVPNTLNPKTFNEASVEGTYVDDTSGQYITFKRDDVEVNVNSGMEMFEGLDLEILSDAEITSDSLEPIMQTFMGTFETGYNKESIEDTAICNFITSQNLGAQYIDFLRTKKVKGNAYLEFLRENGHEESYDEFQEAQRMTETLENYSLKGYWDYKDGNLNLYDERGEFLYPFVVTKNGLTVSDANFSGKTKKGIFGENVFTYSNEEVGYRQSIHTYNDGNLILLSEQNNGAGELSAGVYYISDNVLNISINGSLDRFSITDFGITPFLFNK